MYIFIYIAMFCTLISGAVATRALASPFMCIYILLILGAAATVALASPCMSVYILYANLVG